MNHISQPNLDEIPLEGLHLIEASAGTGKTWTICSLYLRLLLERELDVRQILVVTFTKAATAELRERIRARLLSSLQTFRDESPHEIERLRRIEKALHAMDEAAIFTIHGFCQRALADRPFAAGLAFELELASDPQHLLLESVQDFWRSFIASDKCSAALASYLQLQSDSPQKYVEWLTHHLAKPLARLEWPDDIDELAPLDQQAFSRDFRRARDLWKEQHQVIKNILLNAQNDLNRQTYHPKSLEKAFRAWDQWFSAPTETETITLGESIELLTSSKLEQRKRKHANAPEHRFFELANELISHHKSLIRTVACERFRLIRHMLEWCAQRVQQKRRQTRQTSFDDMLFALHRAMHDKAHTGLAESLARQYPAALIDEFQDTDPLQFEIFSNIYRSSKHHCFFVGDPKQAIYSFRHADLYTYFRARRRADRLFHLTANQRSAPALIQGVNALFSRNKLAFVLPELGFTPVSVGVKPREHFQDLGARHRAFQIWLLPGKGDSCREADSYREADSSGEGDSPSPCDAITAEPLAQSSKRYELTLSKDQAILRSAQASAGEIARLLSQARRGMVRIGERALLAGDIAILVRTHLQGSIMKAALSALNIGSVELSQDSVFHSSDALELERVLLAIQQPKATSLMLAALSTELLGFDAKRIQEGFAQTLDLSEHIDRFFEYRELWHRHGFMVMFRRFLNAEAIAERLLSRFDGERRMTNLLHLGELLHEAAQADASPDSLLAWLAVRRSEESPQETEQLRLESDQHLVQIVTIHKSKGLEFPVVFCPFLWEANQSRRPQSSECLIYDDAAHGATIRFAEKSDQSQAYKAIKEQLDHDAAAESIRLIYVALTRAVHRCYLIAGCYGSGRKRPSRSQSMSSPLNWLVAGDGLSPSAFLFEQALDKDPKALANISTAWKSLSHAHPESISVESLPDGIASDLKIINETTITLSEVPKLPIVEMAWHTTSFSAMAKSGDTRMLVLEEEAVDAGTKAADIGDMLFAEVDDIVYFPRGPDAGSCLHQVLESIDFNKPDNWNSVIDAAVEQAPLLTRESPEHSARCKAMIRSMLDQVFQTDLGEGLVLSKVKSSDRLNELDFTLSAMNLESSVLKNLLRQEQAEALGITEGPALSLQTPQRAFIRGSIDLIIEHEGRFFVLDWKSNHLGYQAKDYAPPKIKQAMYEHSYHLQYLIYTLALHRFLKQRHSAYCYAEHFGGVFYLFLRAIRPEWRNADNTATGVFFTRPSFELIDQLDRLC